MVDKDKNKLSEITSKCQKHLPKIIKIQSLIRGFQARYKLKHINNFVDG